MSADLVPIGPDPWQLAMALMGRSMPRWAIINTLKARCPGCDAEATVADVELEAQGWLQRGADEHRLETAAFYRSVLLSEYSGFAERVVARRALDEITAKGGGQTNVAGSTDMREVAEGLSALVASLPEAGDQEADLRGRAVVLPVEDHGNGRPVAAGSADGQEEQLEALRRSG